MHTETPVEFRFVFCALAAVTAVLYTGSAKGAEATDSAFARYLVAAVGLVSLVLVAFDKVPAVVAYGVLCLALAGVYVADVLRDERARRRRVASLAPRPMIVGVPTAWIVIAAVSPLMLTPYVVLKEQLAAAFMVGFCALVMATIAWRLASAPVQLTGEDVPLERIRDRATRSARVANTAVLAVGSIFVFICFANSGLPVVTPVQRMLPLFSMAVWLGLFTWKMWYVHQLPQPSCSASS